MDIRELRYFIQIAKSGSFNRASTQLNVAQPALSRQIIKLEHEVKAKLLERDGKGVKLTEAGAALLARAEAIVHEVDQAGKLFSGGETSFRGQIVLGMPPICGLSICTEIHSLFRERWPEATLILREGINSSLEEWLLDRRLDLAVVHNPLPLEGIDIEPILQERMALVHALGKNVPTQGDIRIRDLVDIPLILPSLPHSNRRLMERATVQHGIKLNIVAEIDSVGFTIALVKKGVGAAIQTFAGVAAEAEASGLSLLRIGRPPLLSRLCIGMPREGKSNWLTIETARLLRQVITEMVGRDEWPGARVIAKGGAASD